MRRNLAAVARFHNEACHQHWERFVMQEAVPTNDQTRKLWDMIKDIRIAMLTTQDGEVLRSRPMVSCQSTFDGNLWFFTNAGAPKAHEVDAHDDVNASFADPGKNQYVSVSGTARLVRDGAKARQLWAESLRPWFPKGLDDPNLALLCVEMRQGEYWDSPSGAMVVAYRYAKAAVTGGPTQATEHAKVTIEGAR